MKTLMKVIKRVWPEGSEVGHDSEVRYTSNVKNLDEQMKFFQKKNTLVYCVEFNEDGTTKKIKVNKVFCRSHDLYRHEVMSLGYEF
jgi:endo-alpha-1,4-polygalactosaminidase (GH114 family)